MVITKNIPSGQCTEEGGGDAKCFRPVRPPLSKISFPVGPGGQKKKPVGMSGFIFFVPDLFFYKLECTEGGGGGGVKKN